MRRSLVGQRARSRSGLTQIELIALIIAIVILLAMIIPAVSTSQRTRRRSQCQFNLKELTLATINYANVHDGNIPKLRDALPGQCDASVAPTIPNSVSFHIALLPYLNHEGAVEYVMEQKNPSDANLALIAVLGNHFSVFTCPDNPKHFRQPGANSYVANAGYGEFTVTDGIVSMGGRNGLHSAANWEHWDLAHPPYANSGVPPGVSALDKKIARATGMFWIPDEDGWQNNFDQAVNGDGSGQTLLYGESLNASPLNLTTSPTPLDNAFVVGRTAVNFVHVAPNHLGFTDVPGPFDFKINSNRGTSVGHSPIPSSLHNGGANFAFGDGHVAFVSDTIDPSVYVRLLSPTGRRWGQTSVNEADY